MYTLYTQKGIISPFWAAGECSAAGFVTISSSTCCVPDHQFSGIKPGLETTVSGSCCLLGMHSWKTKEGWQLEILLEKWGFQGTVWILLLYCQWYYLQGSRPFYA